MNFEGEVTIREKGVFSIRGRDGAVREIYYIYAEDGDRYIQNYQINTTNRMAFEALAVGDKIEIRGWLDGRFMDVAKKDGGTFRKFTYNLKYKGHKVIVKADGSKGDGQFIGAAPVSEDMPW